VVRARGRSPNEATALKCPYLVTRPNIAIAASRFVYVFVAATAISGPARVTSARSATAASAGSGSFVTAMVRATQPSPA
jgi:hypothetical protein